MDYSHEKGRWIWIKPLKNSEFSTPIGCQIIRFERGKALIRNDDDDEYWIKLDQIIKSMHVTSVYGVEDMISLGEISECAILRNLRIRYKNKQIYTYTGTVLAAVNPYENLHIYSSNLINKYKQSKLTDLPPHIYAISNLAYCKCIEDNQNQCIVVSGESGAGKTESMKFILQYLTAISRKASSVQQQILEANPILEAFGNAKTIRNDNSSRFGKYIDIQFDGNGAMRSAKFDHYLLEKSRIVSVSPGERNYHIFYMLINGLSDDERDTLELNANRKYNYLTSPIDTETVDIDDTFNDLERIKNAMKILSFCEWEMWQIFQLLAALLHLGNLQYKRKIIENIDATEIRDSQNASRVAHFLGIPKSVLCECLTRRTIYINDERVVSNISLEYAMEIRDSFAKTIYGRIFNWIVHKINNTISRCGANIPNSMSIGVLDIFGFENFIRNSFEQLCINYANESLQQFFVQQIFKMEQNEYNKEKIIWRKIPFIDNQNVLDMIGAKPMNVMSLIDEESKFPKGTDSTLLLKLNQNHGTKSIYIKPMNDYHASFGIRHFAGVVTYCSKGKIHLTQLRFLEKNRDKFGADLKELIAQSSNAFLLSLFEKNSALDSGKKSMTLSLQFKNSLDELMKTLTACNPFFVRCIKPNDFKRPNDFNNELCVRQLRYTGMIETARIRALGYPIRHTFREFVQRYRCLLPQLVPSNESFLNYRELCKRMCATLLKFNPNYQLGQTKVFLKYDQDAYLEMECEKVYLKHVHVLQRFARRISLTMWLKRRVNAAIIIQKYWRGYRARCAYRDLHAAVERLQARIRSRQHTYAYEQYTKNVIRIQSLCRGYLARKAYTIRRVQIQKQKYEEEIQRQRFEAMKDVRKPIQHKLNHANLSHRHNERIEESRKNDDYIIDADKLIDDVFGFLQSPSIDENHAHKRTSNVSKMILNFEAESRVKKAIPTKLLSRPVNFYSYDNYESRL